MNEDELRAIAGDLFADEFLDIEIVGEHTEGGLYVERGPIEGGVCRPDPTMISTGYGLGGYPIDDPWPKPRDLFPKIPAERGAVQYPTVRSEDIWYGPSSSRRAFLRGEIRRLRHWWRAHWWPARIRDLEAELRRFETDLWDD